MDVTAQTDGLESPGGQRTRGRLFLPSMPSRRRRSRAAVPFLLLSMQECAAEGNALLPRLRSRWTRSIRRLTASFASATSTPSASSTIRDSSTLIASRPLAPAPHDRSQSAFVGIDSRESGASTS
uniref:Uncharacterized protein n=1 Tax=Plectus sambesii TaxID=2011161 RepID=A0A914V7D7_9BILA